ncbi:MAG: T9SS type A sorting domain-containing protein, partial [Bacteroidales bacterium]|nr:T9SS type A sorting domain-containing protein [Bacteroidales bacterium]
GGTVYEGYWVIGRNNKSQNFLRDSISEYFDGSLCDIKIEHLPRNSEAPENIIFSSQKSRNDGLHYKLDEGTGTTVTDSLGNNNGIIKGSTPIWSSSNKLSTVRWRKNMTNHPPDHYTFFSRVFYPGGPDTGLVYPLGRYSIKDPFPGEVFYYNVFGALGYFNEGTHLEFPIHYYCGYDFQGHSDWKDNLFKYSAYSPDHRLIHDTTIYYISNNNMGYVGFDAGEAPPGSYMNFTFGYREDNSYNTEVYEHTFSMPVYTRPMIPPIVSGNFGPFDQAIAPGVMQRENTFVITTEIYSDLNKITGRFYNENNEVIASADAVKINETTWHLTYDMATLSPPVTLLEIDYYLGDDEFLGLVQGPFKITIHRTRPVWFDFIPNADFHNATQTGDLVTFNISTTLSQNYLFDNTLEIEIPAGIPIIGETSSKLDAPSTNIYLKYIIPEYKLELNEPPEFYNSVINLGGGKAKYMAFHFNAEQHNSYYLDEHNNLFATQNFATGGSLTSTLEKVENLTEKVVEMINDASDINPDEILISPDFEINFTGSFEYSSRLHLTIDTLTGKWGTVGNLHVDANPEHEEAFENSASFHFYSGSLGVNFGTGIKVFDGVFSVDFLTDMRFILGFGQSYRDLPYYQKRVLKSFAFQIYGKIVTKELWGWFEQTVWGPKMFYSNILWGDDMTDAFPPAEKKDQMITGIPSNSDWPELTDEIIPVSDFFVTPLGYPQQNIQSRESDLLFTWIEKGETYGERCLQARYLEKNTGKFSDKFTVLKNFNAINYPASTFANETTLFFAWNQSRYTSETIAEVQPEEVNKEFVRSQDIWIGVYDIENDSIVQVQMIEDENYSRTSGRTEACPEITALSDSRVLITWQVVDLDNHKSNLWYTIAEKQLDKWIFSAPSIIAEIEGIETDIRLSVPVEDQAVLVWMNTNYENTRYRRLMTSEFHGSDWSQPEELVAFNDYHYINYMDLEFTNGTGAAIWTTFVEDTTFNRYETLSLMPWDPVQNRWRKNEKVILYSDSIHHIQLPQITIDNDGNSVIALKVEQIINPSGKSRISQVDLFKGNINRLHGTWDHIIANQFVCDTLKQVSNLELTFSGTDTLMILSQEYMMAATNAPFEPKNGIMFGDPYMNLVLRSFMIDEEGMVEDIDEHNYFLGIEDEFDFTSSVKLYQNYPNPCTDHTTIQFYIPDNAPVKLELYDINGILIATLVDQKLQPGIYEIELNVSLLKPGFYFYRLISGDSKQTLKMVVGN